MKNYSPPDSSVGGDMWVHNKLYTHLRNTIEEIKEHVLVGDFSAINGGYWRDHLGSNRKGSHLKGDTLDFIPRLPDLGERSLRRRITYENKKMKNVTNNVILQNLDTANVLEKNF